MRRARPTDESNFEVRPCQVRFDRGCAERDRFGPYAFTTTYRPYAVDQTVHHAFSELALAWGENLHFQLAANYENYDVASSFKLGAVLILDPGLEATLDDWQYRTGPASALPASTCT